MDDAKKEIEEMRLKRLEMEAEWKGRVDEGKQSRKHEELKSKSVEN